MQLVAYIVNDGLDEVHISTTLLLNQRGEPPTILGMRSHLYDDSDERNCNLLSIREFKLNLVGKCTFCRLEKLNAERLKLADEVGSHGD